jgi:hypothetical protein
VYWYDLNYTPVHGKYALPHLDIVGITFMICILVSATVGIGYLASIVAVTFFASVFISANLSQFDSHVVHYLTF